jgi:hypothetical protein
MPEIADLSRQAAQKAAIELHVGIVEQQRRLAQPGDHAPRDHVGTPGDGVVRAVEGDPFVDQRTCIGAGDAGLRGTQVAQPAEAQERDGPILGRRGDLERRTGVAEDDLAGEHEPARIDLGCTRRVGGAQVLRRDDDAVGLPEGKRPIDDRMRRYTAGELADEAARQEYRQFGTFRDGNARHRGGGSPLGGRSHSRCGNIAEGWLLGQSWIKPLQPLRRRAA